MKDFDKFENIMLYIGVICVGKGVMWKGGMDFLVLSGKICEGGSIVCVL